MDSVRFICGTQDIHKILEQKLADFIGMDDAILFRLIDNFDFKLSHSIAAYRTSYYYILASN